MWDLLIAGSEEMAEELGLDALPAVFVPASLAVIDGWARDHEGPLDEEEVTKLGLFLARVLVDTHGGGLAIIHQKDHPLDGEWAITGFAKGIANDYHVPFLVSAARIGYDRSLTAEQWYAQVIREGRSLGQAAAKANVDPKRPSKPPAGRRDRR